MIGSLVLSLSGMFTENQAELALLHRAAAKAMHGIRNSEGGDARAGSGGPAGTKSSSTTLHIPASASHTIPSASNTTTSAPPPVNGGVNTTAPAPPPVNGGVDGGGGTPPVNGGVNGGGGNGGGGHDTGGGGVGHNTDGGGGDGVAELPVGDISIAYPSPTPTEFTSTAAAASTNTEEVHSVEGAAAHYTLAGFYTYHHRRNDLGETLGR